MFCVSLFCFQRKQSEEIEDVFDPELDIGKAALLEWEAIFVLSDVPLVGLMTWFRLFELKNKIRTWLIYCEKRKQLNG